jgi:hypothetical protein
MTCTPCRRASKRPGQHRAHNCPSYITTATLITRCDCPCNDLPTGWQPPTMQLDAPTPDQP